MDTIRAVLSQLQILLLRRDNVNPPRTSLILVDQVVITLSASVCILGARCFRWYIGV